MPKINPELVQAFLEFVEQLKQQVDPIKQKLDDAQLVLDSWHDNHKDNMGLSEAIARKQNIQRLYNLVTMEDRTQDLGMGRIREYLKSAILNGIEISNLNDIKPLLNEVALKVVESAENDATKEIATAAKDVEIAKAKAAEAEAPQAQAEQQPVVTVTHEQTQKFEEKIKDAETLDALMSAVNSYPGAIPNKNILLELLDEKPSYDDVKNKFVVEQQLKDKGISSQFGIRDKLMQLAAPHLFQNKTAEAKAPQAQTKKTPRKRNPLKWKNIKKLSTKVLNGLKQVKTVYKLITNDNKELKRTKRRGRPKEIPKEVSEGKPTTEPEILSQIQAKIEVYHKADTQGLHQEGGYSSTENSEQKQLRQEIIQLCLASKTISELRGTQGNDLSQVKPTDMNEWDLMIYDLNEGKLNFTMLNQMVTEKFQEPEVAASPTESPYGSIGDVQDPEFPYGDMNIPAVRDDQEPDYGPIDEVAADNPAPVPTRSQHEIDNEFDDLLDDLAPPKANPGDDDEPTRAEATTEEQSRSSRNELASALRDDNPQSRARDTVSSDLENVNEAKKQNPNKMNG